MDEKGLYGNEVVDLYNKLSEAARKEITLEMLYTLQLGESWEQWKTHIDALSSKKEEEILMLTFSIKSLVKTQLGWLQEKAEKTILGLPGKPKLPNEIDGYVAATCCSTQYDPKGRDPWNCARGRGDEHQESYDTVQSSALFSATTVQSLTADNVHFMMPQ